MVSKSKIGNPKSEIENRAAFHVMLKPRGAICNLDCQYCFYLRKEALYPDASFRMSDATLESFTRQYIEAQQVPEVTFAWQGGEPTLMGLDFFRRAAELQHKYRVPGMKINNSFQTNGILLDDEWCQFFRLNQFLIGISLDGPAPLHDAYRVDKGGRPTFDRVMRAIELMKKHQVEFNILACVNNLSAERPVEVYRFFRDEVGTQFIQFIPIVEKKPYSPASGGNCIDAENIPASAVSSRSVSGGAFGAFLNAIFDEWVRHDVGKVFVQLFDVSLAAWAGYRPGLCVHEETCGQALAMEHNGDLYACDHFVDPGYFLGNILEKPLAELVNLPRQRQFGGNKKNRLPSMCRQCRVRFICNGGCPKDRILKTPQGEPGLNYLCAGYQAFFTHVDRPMKHMARLLQEGRPPAEIMDRFSSSGRKRHRRS